MGHRKIDLRGGQVEAGPPGQAHSDAKATAAARVDIALPLHSGALANVVGLKPTTQQFEVTIDSNGGLYETLEIDRVWWNLSTNAC